jgi:hypothetical protein
MDEKGHIRPPNSHEEHQESHGKSHGLAERQAITVDCGQVLADRIFRVPLRFNDDAINTVLAGARLCACMLAHGVLPAAAEAALDAMASSFEARLTALDRASAQTGGHA